MNDVFFIQFLVFYIMYLIYFSKNIYFILFYLFIQFFCLGLVLSLFNLDLFTAFLWLSECVIIFISVLMLFFLNVFGLTVKQNDKIFMFKYGFLFILLFILLFITINYYNNENYCMYNLDFLYIWDDYYESLYNTRMNDMYILQISFYILNSIELLIIGVILLIASIICVNLNKYSKSNKTSNYYDLLNIFNFFKDFLKFSFIRKQNLTNQALHNPSIKIFKKKKK